MIVHRRSPLAQILRPFGYTAICLGQHVFTHLDELSPRELAHEAKHAEQWRRYGAFGFLTRYLYYHFRYGYRANPLEVEARSAAGEL